MRSEPSPNRHQLSLRRSALSQDAPYQAVFGDVSKIIDAARESAARSVNAAMTAAYWLIGRRIVEFEQSGEERAEYGVALMERLAEDLTAQFGRGFSSQNIYNMRLFYLSYHPNRILQTLSGELAPRPRRPSDGLSAALVRLRAAPVGQRRARPLLLRSRGASRRVVGPPARPADRLTVLRANRPIEEQARHADQGKESPFRRPRAAR